MSLLLACAGGPSNNGGNGNSSSTSGTSSPPSSPPSPPPNSDAVLEGFSGEFDDDLADSFLSDDEFLDMNSSNRGNALSPNELIKAHVAYGYGLSGKGTKIAIMDEGALLKSHDEFQSKNIKTFDNGQLANHSNAVTALAAGSRNNRGMMGVAYGADILSTTFDDLPASKFEDKVDWITENDGDVWGNSWGLDVPTANDQINEVVRFRNTQGLTSGQAIAEALQAPGTQNRWDAIAEAMDKYQSNGGVVVWANDNAEEFTDAGIMPGLPELYPELKEAWIVVTNTTAVSTLRNAGINPSSFKREGGHALLSAPCGSTASYCVSMDGFQIKSAVSTGGRSYRIFSGTSMGTPMVAGAIALLREAFPNNTAEQLTIRALATADNSWFSSDGVKNWGSGITHGYSSDFGHGFIDLERALQPLGTVTATSASSQSFVLSHAASEIQMSPAFGESVQNSLSEKRFIMQDGLDGRFLINLGNFVRRIDPEEVEEIKTDWQRQRNRQLVQAPLASGLVVQFDQQFQPDTLINQRNGSSIQIQAALSNGSTLRASYGGSINTALAFQPNSGNNTVLAQSEPFEIPFTTFAADSAWGAWHSGSPSRGWTVGWFGNKDEEYASTGVLADRAWSFGNLATFTVTGGTLTEQGGLMGSRTTGAFANDISTTTFARGAVGVNISRAWRIMANYMIGHSWAEANQDTLFTDFSNLMTDSFAVSLSGENVLTGKDHLQLTLFQPLRAMSGSATVTLPTSQDASNNYALLYTSDSIDLTPNGRELRIIGSYSQEPWEGTLIDLTTTLTHQRLHNPDSGLAASVFSGIKFEF